jgi:hypothetical protein
MKAEIQLRWTDYLSAQYLNMRPRPVLAVLGTILLLLVVYVAAYGLCHPNHRRAGMIILAFLAYLVLTFFVLLPLKARRIFRQQRNLQVTTDHEFEEQGVTSTSQIGQSRLTWRDFLKWKESKRLIVLYTSDVMMIIFPRRCFPDQATWDAFRRIVSTNVKKKP